MNDLPASSIAREHGAGVHRAILESINQGFCTIEVAFDEHDKPVDYRFLEVSSSFERQTGIENGAGRWMREIAPDQDQFWFDIYGRVALTGEPEQFENFSTPLDRWFSVNALKIDGAGRVAVLFDDITDRKRAEAALHASEERFRGFVTASADVVYRMSPDWTQMRELDGQGFIDDTPEPSEDWMDQYILPEDRDLVHEAINRAIRTKSQFDLEHRVIRADGTPGWTKSRAIPMHGEHGEITEWLGTASDITQAKSEREALRQSEERYRTLFEVIDAGFCILDLIFGEDGRVTDYRFVEANPAFERQSGLVGAVGRRIREFAPDLEEHWFERYGRVALTGVSMRVEGEAAPLGRWFDINAFRVGAPEQRRVAVLFTDISARRNAEAVLRESEERQAFLLRFSDALRAQPNDAAVVDLATRMLAEQLGLDRCYAIAMYPAEDRVDIIQEFRRPDLTPMPSPLRFSDFPEGGKQSFDRTLIFNDTANDPALTDIDKRSLAAMSFGALLAPSLRLGAGKPIWALGAVSSQPRRWTDGEIALVEEVAERTWAAVERSRAEAELRESERLQGLLLAELQHRVRNILTIVRSFARRTADSSDDVDDYVRHLDGRLAALARVQAILTRDPSQGVDRHDMVMEELRSQAASPAHYQIEGPKVGLSAKAAEVLSLAVHELTTNSTKYGILSKSSGTIQIRWAVDDRNGQAWLLWNWHEPVGSKIGRPARNGFGTELIVRRVPYELRGTGHLLIGDEGVEAKIDFPLANALRKLEIVSTDRNTKQ